jgi:hypothetical protein
MICVWFLSRSSVKYTGKCCMKKSLLLYLFSCQPDALCCVLLLQVAVSRRLNCVATLYKDHRPRSRNYELTSSRRSKAALCSGTTVLLQMAQSHYSQGSHVQLLSLATFFLPLFNRLRPGGNYICRLL